MGGVVDHSRIHLILIARNVGILVIALSPPVLARAGQQEPASIVGVVTDESGAVLPGVTVAVSSPALQVGSMTTVTDLRGEYRLRPLSIGTYAVEFTLSGFQTLRRQGVQLPAAFVAKIDVAMMVGALSETVTVSGVSPVVDPVSTAPTTVLTRETLDTMPSGRNGAVSFMEQAPGVRPQIDTGGDSMSSPPVFRAFGQENQPWQQIEGVLVSAAKNTAQGGVYWDYNMVEEAKVGTFGSAAEIGTRGIAINGLLKSGGNTFHGTGFFAGQSEWLQSGNIDDGLRAQGISSGDALVFRTDVSGDLGGRVVADKLWFYATARQRAFKENTLDCLQPNGEVCFGTDRQIFNTQKLSWQISQSNRLIGFHTYARKITLGSGSALLAWESRQGLRLPSHVWKTEWQSVIGNSIVLSALVGDMHWTSQFRGFGFGEVLRTDSVLGTTTGMNATDGEDPDDYNHQPFRGSISWYRPDLFLGHHDIKVGGDVMWRRSDRPRTSRSETWRWAQKFLNVEVPENDAKNYQLQFLNGVANRLIAFNYPTTPIDLQHYTSMFVQDSWRAGRLTLNLGGRYAYDNGFAPEQCREAAEGPASVAFPAQCFQKVQMKIFHSFAPRLHAAFDIAGDGKTVVKGGWGRFMFMRYTDQTQHANWNQSASVTYTWRDLNGNRDYDRGEVNLDPNGPDYITTSQSGGGETVLGVPNPDEEQGGTDEFSVSIEREVVANVAVRLTGIYSKTFNFQRLQNNRRPSSVYTIPITNRDPGPDNVLNTADDPGTSITYYDFPAEYAGVRFQEPMLINDSNADQQYKSVEVALSRRLANRWQIYGSFSYTTKHIPFIANTGGGSFLAINTVNPNSEINNDDNTNEWLGRISGSYMLPFGVTLAANLEHRSGSPQRRTAIFRGGRQIPQITLPTEQLGDVWRLPHINIMDLNVQKAFPIRSGQSMTLRMNVFNLLNANTITGRSMASGPNFLRTTSIIQPRIAELSVSYRF